MQFSKNLQIIIFQHQNKNELNPLRLRTLPSGVSNTKYLAFDTPNTKKSLSSSVVNAKIFGMSEQYALK